MKYGDPITGELKDIYVKASDTFPIGGTAEIPDDMPIPDGWEEVEDNITLFESTAGDNSYEIQLNASVANYSSIEVFAIGDSNIHIYEKIDNPNTATFEMSSEIMFEGTEYISKALCAFINDKFYKYQDREYKIDISQNNVRTVNQGSWLKITKIVGHI